MSPGFRRGYAEDLGVVPLTVPIPKCAGERPRAGHQKSASPGRCIVAVVDQSDLYLHGEHIRRTLDMTMVVPSPQSRQSPRIVAASARRRRISYPDNRGRGCAARIGAIRCSAPTARHGPYSHEVSCRTWQWLKKGKEQRGAVLDESGFATTPDPELYRQIHYNPRASARSSGHVGSLWTTMAKLADKCVVWASGLFRPANRKS